MFKIEIEKRTLLKGENYPLYFIRYELVPDISKGVENRIIHEANYKNLQIARKNAEILSNYLSEINLILDLVYTKLKQIEVSLNQTNSYLRIDFNKIEKSRIHLLVKSSLILPAYIHIDNLIKFLNNLKYWCFAISKDFYTAANQLFKMLLNVEESFVNNYRSAQILSEKNQLKIFL